MGRIEIQGYICERCKHIWKSRRKEPTVCPKCKSPYWDIPRRIKRKVRKNENQRFSII